MVGLLDGARASVTMGRKTPGRCAPCLARGS